MAQISKVLNRPVLSKIDSCIIGKVCDAFFDEFCKNIAYFVIADGDTEFAVPFGSVASFSDAVVLENKEPLLTLNDIDTSAFLRAIFGRSAYSVSGKLKGDVDEINFTLKGRITSLTAGGVDFSPSSFLSFGEVLVLKDGTGTKRVPRSVIANPEDKRIVTILSDLEDIEPKRDASQVSFPRPAEKYVPETPLQSEISDADTSQIIMPYSDGLPVESETEQIVVKSLFPDTVITPVSIISAKPAEAISEQKEASLDIFNIKFPSDEDEDTAGTPIYVQDGIKPITVFHGEEDHVPPRIIADYNFLLGRELLKDLTSYVGEILAVKGTRITVEIVELARKHGKLVELTLNSGFAV